MILMFENILPFKRKRTPLRCVLFLWYNLKDISLFSEIYTEIYP